MYDIIVEVKLENRKDKDFTVDEIEQIYNLAVRDKKIVICTTGEKTTNIFIDNAHNGKAIIASCEKENLSLCDENTGMAKHRFIVKTDLEKVKSILEKTKLKKEEAKFFERAGK